LLEAWAIDDDGDAFLAMVLMMAAVGGGGNVAWAPETTCLIRPPRLANSATECSPNRHWTVGNRSLGVRICSKTIETPLLLLNLSHS
jgi:hypothetical protein